MNLYSVDVNHVMFNLRKIRTSERSPHLKMLHSDFLYSPFLLLLSSLPPSHLFLLPSSPPPPPLPALPPCIVSNSSASRERRRGQAIHTTSPWRPRRERSTTIARHPNPTCVHITATHGVCVCLPQDAEGKEEGQNVPVSKISLGSLSLVIGETCVCVCARARVCVCV